MRTEVEYLPDREVDAATDRVLRELLTVCFTKPQDVVFRDRRYFVDPYPHRWIVRNSGERIVAHVGGHEKSILAGGRVYRVGGIGDVCVHPEFRGRGYVREMLSAAHAFMARQGFDFALLFGRPEVYGSSGYRPVENLFIHADPANPESELVSVRGLARCLGETQWPAAGAAVLPGFKF